MQRGTWQLMTYVLLNSPAARVLDSEFVADVLILYFPGNHLFGVYLVGMTAVCTIRMAGELTALKPIFIALLLNGICNTFFPRQC